MCCVFDQRLGVVYFDQQTGDLHAVHWSKSFFNIFPCFSVFFHHIQEKRRKSTNTKLYRPAKGMQSTRLPVKITNNYLLGAAKKESEEPYI